MGGRGMKWVSVERGDHELCGGGIFVMEKDSWRVLRVKQ
jgi:hypothetical protein